MTSGSYCFLMTIFAILSGLTFSIHCWAGFAGAMVFVIGVTVDYIMTTIKAKP